MVVWNLLFNSLHFLLFFPIVSLCYFLLPHKLRWIWLLIASYYFYMAWNPYYAVLMAISTIITYLSGLLITRTNMISDDKKRVFQRKLWVALSFSSNFAILFFFKYFDFAIVNINRILSCFEIQTVQPAFDVLLPVGISFYTFQALSYTMDVYRGEIYAEKNLAKYALFVSFFPQLVAGPIERSKNLLIQINERHNFDYDDAKNGLLLMMWGYFQKMVVADRIAIMVNTVYENYSSYYGFQIIIATVLFAIQIYCDFAGYSNIAKGAAQTMGFRLMDNFQQPYFSRSIQEFWRRWHISLSTWFRDYLYIPLGGSRCSRPRRYLNLMITFLVSGLWHGASWNFVVWGGIHGVYQITGNFLKANKEKIFTRLKIRTEPLSFKLGQMLTTFLLVDFAWIFFRAPGARAALGIIQRIISHFGFANMFDMSSYAMGIGIKDVFIIGVSIIILLLADCLQYKFVVRNIIAEQNFLFRWAFYYVSLFVIVYFGALGSGTGQEFLYFQF